MAEMQILYCVDEANNQYSRHLGVSLFSLFETHKKHTLHVYIISTSLAEENQVELERIASLYGQHLHFFIGKLGDIIPKSLQDLLIWDKKGTRPFTIFYRMFFAIVFPEIKGRILYLDCDTLIINDVSSLYSVNFEGNALAGVLDVSWMRYRKKQTLGVDRYINSGVLLINIPVFTAANWEKALLRVNEQYGEVLTHYDQDYLNLLFKGHIKIMPYQMNCLIYRPYFLPYDYKKAAILHTVNRPFLKPRIVPLGIARLYASYLAKTKWKDFDL
ncbi:MAG: glycosyltransferase family 8 protein [Candidatus Peribacteria bacterium]|jgi:lipopolysaccharide biosynthesis glycosyltransferase|nr:glycosyltransferase family 8 protein [Candidatus Peribacteria bacterium]